jgi:hypothetical protein
MSDYSNGELRRANEILSRTVRSPTMTRVTVAGTNFRPTPYYITLRDETSTAGSATPHE